MLAFCLAELLELLLICLVASMYKHVVISFSEDVRDIIGGKAEGFTRVIIGTLPRNVSLCCRLAG